MATEEQKKQRMIKLFNGVVFGFGKGLYELFGDSAMAAVSTIGDSMIAEMEHDLGLEIQGQNPQDLIMELQRLLIDEYGLFSQASFHLDPPNMEINCQDCVLWQATQDMLRVGAPVFHCVPMMIAQAAMQKRRGMKLKFVGLTQNEEQHQCRLSFLIMG